MDKEKNIRRLKKEFVLLDQYYFDLNNKLIADLKEVIFKFYPSFTPNTKTKEYIKLFASYLINSTETVIDKAFNYPEYRLDQELRNTKKIAKKEVRHAVNLPFEKELSETAKRLLVENFPEIFELNAQGFRLLDVNTNIYTQYFLSDFYFDDFFNK